MFNRDHSRPAFACIALAILFPIYWIYAINAAGPDLSAGFAVNVTQLDWSDALYLVIGLLEIVVLMGLRNCLHDRHDYRGLDVVLFLSMANTALFSVGLVLLDVVAVLMGGPAAPNVATLIDISGYLTMGCMFCFGALAIAMALMLLSESRQFPLSLKLFAVTTLLWGAFQVTILFGFMVIVLFPLSLLVLAAYMLAQPEFVEVV